jgi:hypothetical protein
LFADYARRSTCLTEILAREARRKHIDIWETAELSYVGLHVNVEPMS